MKTGKRFISAFLILMMSLSLGMTAGATGTETDTNEELTEEELEMVMGGMSDMQAMEVISTAYWDLCVKKKANTRFSKTQIYEALNRCHAINRRTRNGLSDIGKITSLLLRELSI